MMFTDDITPEASMARAEQRIADMDRNGTAPRYADDCDTLDPYGEQDEYAGSYGSWPVAYRPAL